MNKINYEQQLYHPILPVIHKDSKILILGTFPSPLSREVGFFYGNPRNRFWKVMQILFDSPPLETTEQKKTFLKEKKIALWDVLESCKITGASDSSIKDPVVNDIAAKIKGTDIRAIFTTGQKAGQLYKKYCQDKTGIVAQVLPSTSPANCAMHLDTLVKRYAIIKKELE